MMFNSPVPQDPALQFEIDKRLITISIDQIRQDDGTAIAYMYCGDDEEFRRNQECLSVYAMVRDEPDLPRDLKRVDYYLPTVIAEEERAITAEQGYVRVGFIDNHYNDVLGLAAIPNVTEIDEEMYAECFTIACLNRLTSLDDATAIDAAMAWALNEPTSVLQGKREVMSAVTRYYKGLEIHHRAS